MSVQAPPSGATSPRDGPFAVPSASYVPYDLKYSADFEDSLMSLILDHGAKPDGIRIISEDSDEAPVDGVSVRASDIPPHSLPTFSEDELPLPLAHPRRVFASPIPGLKLTHPGGYLEGGPGLDPDMDTFPDDFLSNNPNVASAEDLRAAVDRDIASSLHLLKERLRARRRAIEKNEQTERHIRSLVDQHSMELKIQRRMVEEQKAKKEAKLRRRSEREGG